MLLYYNAPELLKYQDKLNKYLNKYIKKTNDVSDDIQLIIKKMIPDKIIDNNDCSICFEKTEIIFIPCGHKCTCLECYEQVNNCPLCRADIKVGIPIKAVCAEVQ